MQSPAFNNLVRKRVGLLNRQAQIPGELIKLVKLTPQSDVDEISIKLLHVETSLVEAMLEVNFQELRMEMEK